VGDAGGRRAEDALPRADREPERHPRANQGAVAEDLGMVRRWGLVARPLDAPPDPRVVVPCGYVARLLTPNVYEYASAEGCDLLVPHARTRTRAA
jgi:hypothetical protein